MNRIIKLSGILFLVLNGILSSWSVLHNDIYYYTDIGRDFLIFDEIVTKKIVLLGPRADMQGLFHGILWHYLQIPAYIIGGGNPVVMGWFWIGLTIAFVVSVYFVVKDLFDDRAALFASVLNSGVVVPVSQGFFHGNGAMLIMPLFFYFFVKYVQTYNWRYLLLHLIIVGMLVQFEIAVGGPLAILSVLATAVLVLRNKRYNHALCLGVLLLFASTFLFIDIRHDFLQTRSLIAYLHGTRDNNAHTPYLISLLDRIKGVATHGINVFQQPLYEANILIFALLCAGMWAAYYRKDSNRIIYAIFTYFYFGYYVLTMLHGGLLIMFWWIPVSVLPIMMFASVYRQLPRPIYTGIFIGIVCILTYQNISYIQKTNSEIGTVSTSWQFHQKHAFSALKIAPINYGYFVYAPDIYGYQDKYALLYINRKLKKHGIPFEKRAITYVFSEPPPKNFTGHDTDWWVKEKLKISSEPIETRQLDKGYEVRTYKLTPSDLSTPSEITPADWLFYR